ncbi:hypothetical protein ACOUVU_02870 [Acinetobacter baumannii]
MASTPRITNYDEVLGLPGFLEQNLITPENFDSVFSDYQIRDRDMHCCLVSDRGLCNHKHNFGYVIKLKDGSLSIMGNDCAERKFGTNGGIIQGISLYENTKEAEKKLGKVFDFAIRIDEYIERLRKIEVNLKIIEDYYFNLKLNIGSRNYLKLNERYKAANTKVEVKTYKLGKPDPDNPNEETLIYMATHTIGHISSLNIFDDRNFKEFEKKVFKLREALRDALKSHNQIIEGEKIQPAALRKRVNTILSQLNSFDEVETTINTRVSDIEKFRRTDPEILCYLTDDYEESKIFASLSMAFHGIENMKEETYLRSLEIKYSTAFRCHRIKAADHSVMRRSIFY